MKKRPTLKVSKTDAAKRQLETAIRLWFFLGDSVSIHTLAAAAHQLLHDLGRKRGAPTILRGLAVVRPEKRKQLKELVSRYENFFKHADRDSGALLDFNPEATEILLLDAVLSYENLTQEIPPILGSLKAWIFMHSPHLMNDEDRQKFEETKRSLLESGVESGHMTKTEFFVQHQAELLKYGIG